MPTDVRLSDFIRPCCIKVGVLVTQTINSNPVDLLRFEVIDHFLEVFPQEGSASAVGWAEHYYVFFFKMILRY